MRAGWIDGAGSRHRAGSRAGDHVPRRPWRPRCAPGAPRSRRAPGRLPARVGPGQGLRDARSRCRACRLRCQRWCAGDPGCRSCGAIPAASLPAPMSWSRTSRRPRRCRVWSNGRASALDPQHVACHHRLRQAGPLEGRAADRGPWCWRARLLAGMPGFRPARLPRCTRCRASARRSMTPTASPQPCWRGEDRPRPPRRDLADGRRDAVSDEGDGRAARAPRVEGAFSGSAPFYSVYPCADGQWVQLGCVHIGFITTAASYCRHGGAWWPSRASRLRKGGASPEDKAELAPWLQPASCSRSPMPSGPPPSKRPTCPSLPHA